MNIADRNLWNITEPLDLGFVYFLTLRWVRTPGWMQMREKVKNVFGGFEKLKVVELGSGIGKMSIVMNLLGARTTLVDYNETVIEEAKRIHQAFGCNSEFLVADLLSLPVEFKNRFDVSMSFGTAEHFRGKDRENCLRTHTEVLRNGGLTIIQVPNKFGVFYRMVHSTYKLLKSSCHVYEKEFSKTGIFHMAEKLGLQKIGIIGTSTILSEFKFVIDEILSVITRHSWDRLRYNLPSLHEIVAQDLINKLRFDATHFQRGTNFIDNPVARNLLLFGVK